MSTRSTDAGSGRAQIQVLDTDGEVRESFSVPFNPSEYDVERGVQYDEQPIPGYTSPVTQFVNGEAGTLSMELFFDTYEAREDVRQYTERIESLLELDRQRNAPPVLRVAWAGFQFTCVLERANTTYSMFLPNGTPVRARTNVTFKEYATPAKQKRDEYAVDENEPRVRVVTEGDTLWAISGEEYGDPNDWRAIADENGVDEPRRLQPGTELTIPVLEDQ